jgi:hypothetical protein
MALGIALVGTNDKESKILYVFDLPLQDTE